MRIDCIINGRSRSFDVDPTMRLRQMLLINGDFAVRDSDDCEGFCGSDTVLVDGRPLPAQARRHWTVMLNKPVGYVTTMSDERGRPCIADLVGGVGSRVYPVGRLDIMSEGLLLLTNDGELANKLTHPRYHKPKIYRVEISGELDDETARALSVPFNIDGYITKPAKISVVSKGADMTVLEMTLFEGRNRQIRKMCDSLGLHIRKLTRTAIGDVKLGNLALGRWRHLTKTELDALRR